MKRFIIPDFSNHEEMECFVDELRSERDERTWAIGALADRYCIDRPLGGKPSPQDYTTAKLAHRIGEKPGFVSECRNNWRFWFTILEDIPESASWRQCADARRNSGWRPGEDVTQEYLRRALKALVAVVGTIPRPPDTRPSWMRQLERAAGLLAKVAADPETPELVRLAARTLIDFWEIHRVE